MHYYYSITSKIFPSNFAFTYFFTVLLNAWLCIMHDCALWPDNRTVSFFTFLTKITFYYQKFQLKQLHIIFLSSNAIFEQEHLILQHLYFKLIISALAYALQNIAIMHEQSKWHEAQPSASDEANALLLLSNLGRKHILMARSEAEGPNFQNY